MLRPLLLALGIVLGAAQAFAATDAERDEALKRHGLDPASSILDRIGEPDPSVIKMFTDEGMAVPPTHMPSEAERQEIAAALDKLPPLQQQYLQERLRRLSFLEGMPNNALTSTVNTDEPYKVFDITVRAGALDETISELVTKKEMTLFDTAGSAVTVSIEAGEMDAMVYLFLHEGTHVVDIVLGITGRYEAPKITPFTDGEWADRLTFAEAYRGSALEGSRWHQGGGILPATTARELYEALLPTPFASVYASANWYDDLAELVTWRHLTEKLGQPYRIVLRDGDAEMFSYEPLTSDLVRSRLPLIEMFYAPG